MQTIHFIIEYIEKGQPACAMSEGIGSAVYVAIISAIYNKNLKAGLSVLGNLSIGGAIEQSLHFADKVTLLSDNGAKTGADWQYK